ncbi:MAG: glycosyltransferase, partial [Acidimicrobiales bacterium]
MTGARDEEAEPAAATVLATILTYNAPDALVRCLRAVLQQTRPPDAVVVVDNASVRPVADVLREAGLDGGVSVLRQVANGGPAGGHAAALGAFLSSEHARAWVMDDDCVPEPGCLKALLREAQSRRRPAFVFPRWVQPDGAVTHYPAWCGFLIAREIVEQVGLPMEELFWWAEDTEYLFWRIPRAGHPAVHAPAATVHHTQVRAVHGNPPWKYYYETRNNVFFHLYVKRRLGRLPQKLTLTVARATFRERKGRARIFAMIVR